jgi:N-acetylglucosamine-6-sulfatase
MRGSGRSVFVRRSLRLSLVAALAAGAAIHPTPGAHATPPPNIVLILTDDQRWDSLWAMRNLQTDLVTPGITFDNGFVVNPLCCPSRASILTGEYSHGTQVYRNGGTYGGYRSFDSTSTVATWLHDGGYRTALVGKYLNNYTDRKIPPGWDRWVAFKGKNASYYNYTLNIDGTLVSYGSAEADYSTDVLATQADAFIRAAPAEQPLFMLFSPYAPHPPATTAPRHALSFRNLPPARPPNFNEEDVSDKPAWLQSIPPLSSGDQANVDRGRRNAYRSLLAVDEALHDIVVALTDTGRLSNTMIVFTSDNGLAHGEHRRALTKGEAYEEVIRVPFVVRFDPMIPSPRTDDHLVTNIDLAPTFAAVAGVTAPGAEGLDLLPLIADPSVSWRDDFLIEHMLADSYPDLVPTYCAVRSEAYLLVVYQTGEEELYDLALDPFQLTNVVTDPGYAAVDSALRARIQQLCAPTPPGFTFGFDALPPTTPGNLQAPLVGNTEVQLSWTASTDNIAVTGYTIYRDGVELAAVDGATTSYVDGTVLPETTYAYTVDAFDGAGNRSTQSDPVVVTTPPDTEAPTTPTGLMATAVEATHVDLSWTASTDDVAVTGYTIYRDGAPIGLVDGLTTSYVDSSVSPGTTYTYTVDAFDAAGNRSTQSDPVVVTTPPDTEAPTVPTELMATAVEATHVDLSWTASTDDVAVTGYTIYRDGAPIGLVDGLTTSYVDSSVSPGTTYTYTVDAFDAAGNHSPASDPLIVTTPI